MSFGVLAAGIAASGQLISTLVKNRQDKKRYQQQLKDQQKMWQQANSYNSPAAQRMRLQQAGLNPNLVYQNGGATPTSDTVTPPSFADAPMMDFTSTAQMLQQSPVLSADIRKVNAEAEAIESENKDRFQPLSKLYNLNEDEKQYYATQYGMSVEEMDSYNMNRLQLLAALKKASSENENVREIYNILLNEQSQAESEAGTARLIELLTFIELNTESKKHGAHLSINSNPYSRQGHNGERFLDMGTVYDMLRDKSNNYVLEMYLRELKELHWQSSDAKHILDEAHQFIRDIPVFGSLRRGKPTLRGIDRSGYDSKRGNWHTYDKYDYGK